MKYLKYRVYGAGLSNQRMSLDMGVALAHFTDRALAPYGFLPLMHSGQFLPGQKEKYNICDLFDLPVPSVRADLMVHPESGENTHVLDPERLGQYICVDSDDLDNERFEEFVGGRNAQPLRLDTGLAQWPILDFTSHRNFCNAATFFYIEPNAYRELVGVVRKIQPKKSIQDFAHLVTQMLGSYNAIHVRQGDFLKNNHPFDIRDPETLLNNALELFDPNERLVISTDQENSPNFALLTRDFPDHIFLESFITETPELAKAFDELPMKGEVVMGIVCQLVCAAADRFAGSLRSTFTSYIHRTRGEADMLFINSLRRKHVHIKNGLFQVVFPEKEFSWARTGWNLDVDPHTIGWMREWPEVLS